MSGRHTGQNQFHGSTGGTRSVRGGQRTVRARDVIGAFDCWCQGLLCQEDPRSGMRTWPGIEDGQPHPRLEIMEVEVATSQQDYLERKQIRAYPKSVQDLLMLLVNECHIRCRLIDGESMLLYPPDGESRPFKVMSRRGAKATIAFLHRQFIDEYGVEMPKKTQPETPAVETTKETEVGEPTTTYSDAQRAPVPQPSFSGRPKNLPPAPAEPEPDTETVWRPVHSTKDASVMPDWETDGTHYRCKPCFAAGEVWMTTERKSIPGHRISKHNPEAFPTPETRSKADETRRQNRQLRKRVEAAIADLMDSIGMERQDTAALEAEVQLLNEKVATLTGERDAAIEEANEAKARLALLREALEV